MATMEEFARSLEVKGRETMLKYKSFAELCEEEARHGVALSMLRVVVVARKDASIS